MSAVLDAKTKAISQEGLKRLPPNARQTGAVAKSVAELVGSTPVLELTERINNTHAKVLLKLESENPIASVKDRLARSIILCAEQDGKIKRGVSTLIESTSGNTGVALAALGAALGYKVVICMPETMSLERRALIRIFGARLVLTPAKEGIKGSMAMAKKIAADTPDAYLTLQFETEYNAIAHRETTGPEIWDQTSGNVDFFVSGSGTGGTVSGAGAFLKSKNPALRVVTVEPAESQMIAGGAHSPHKIQGIGPGFVPDTFDRKVVDEVIPISSDDAIAMGRRLPAEAGLFTGVSAGAAVAAALQVAARPDAKGKTVVVIIPSFGERYLSTPLYASLMEEVKTQEVVSAQSHL